jgi:hypothetical protein
VVFSFERRANQVGGEEAPKGTEGAEEEDG